MLPQKQWYDSSTADPEQVKQLCREWNTNPYVAEILLRRGYKTHEEIKSFLLPSLNNLRDPYELRQMREAVDLLQDTIAKNLRIVILGDYDVDGITATALMLEFLSKCGKLDLDFFIPNRIKHGYGLTESSTDILLEMKPDLVITVDNGITAVREVQRLNDEGIKTIITDHHLADASLLPSGIVVNPNHPECKYPFKKISGCGVALKLIMSLRKSLRDSGWWTAERPEPNLRESLDLAALGTVADVMPLVDENRIVTHHGLLVMNEKPRMAIQVLQKLKNVKTITSRTLGFQFAPLLNAAGRLEDADMAVHFLLSNDLQDAEKMTFKHAIKADDIQAIPYENNVNKVYGKMYEVSGNTATQIQFHATDSIANFITGALYFYARPNYDSLYPSIAYLRKDIMHLMETLVWEKH